MTSTLEKTEVACRKLDIQIVWFRLSAEMEVVMANGLRNIEPLILEEVAAVCCLRTVDALIVQRDTDIQRLTAGGPVMRTPKEIQDRLQALLIVCIEVMAEHCQDDCWNSGLEGAVLQGRLSIIRQTLDWLRDEQGRPSSKRPFLVKA